LELTEYTKHFADKFRNLANSYFREDQQLSTSQRCCVSLTSNEFSIVCINHTQGENEIVFLEKFKFDDEKSLGLVLSGMAEQRHLMKTPVSWLLRPDDYQLNLIESIPVPANELRTAISWRIRSLLPYPFEEAAMEYFELPGKKGGQNTPLIAAVTAQKKILSPTISLLQNCGLKLVNIDIPELALLNLSSLHETDEKCTAFLYFYENMVILNISSKKVLYFTRRLIIPFVSEREIDYEKLSLEILRYFDFFRSQWRLSSPTRIFAAAESVKADVIAKALSERLLNTVLPFSMNPSQLNAENIGAIEDKFLLGYGCLLSKDAGHAATKY
jgi:MSHA biogenesis protein MshI